VGSNIFSPLPTFLSGLYSPMQALALRRVLTAGARARNQSLWSGVKTAES
jgi:hypothetical protein